MPFTEMRQQLDLQKQEIQCIESKFVATGIENGTGLLAVVAVQAINELRQQLAAYAGRSILIADDNPVARRVLSNLCQALGFTVEAHAAGDTALAALRRPDHDILAALLDWQMPAPNGLDIVEALRQAAPTRRPKLILLSSLIATSTSQAGYQAADAVLLKPTSLRRMHATLSKALGLDHPVTIAPVVSAPDLSSIQQLKDVEILVVDDIELNRDLMSELFATAGINIRLASNGAEAIAMVRAQIGRAHV